MHTGDQFGVLLSPDVPPPLPKIQFIGSSTSRKNTVTFRLLSLNSNRLCPLLFFHLFFLLSTDFWDLKKSPPEDKNSWTFPSFPSSSSSSYRGETKNISLGLISFLVDKRFLRA